MDKAVAEVEAEAALRATQAWVEHAVIGLNLCPFAKAVQVKGLIRYVCSDAHDTAALQGALRTELQRLAHTPAEQLETTLLVHPGVLQDFLDYNDFLAEADALLDDMGLEGTLQIASFHPQYQFEGTEPDAPENGTNRSPFPMLHLLREASITEVANHPETLLGIPERNIETMRRRARPS